MTREEARENLEKLAVLYEEAAEQSRIVDYSGIIETLRFASSNLRSITKEQVEKMRGEIVETVENGRMKRVSSCCGCDFTDLTCWIAPRFCPACGSPLTNEAVDFLVKRLEEVQKDG